MVRVYPITPQSQFKNNSRATVPLSQQLGGYCKQYPVRHSPVSLIFCHYPTSLYPPYISALLYLSFLYLNYPVFTVSSLFIYYPLSVLTIQLSCL